MAYSKQPCPLHLVRCVVPVLHRGVEFSPGIADETRIQRRRGIVLRHLSPSQCCHTHLPLWTLLPRGASSLYASHTLAYHSRILTSRPPLLRSPNAALPCWPQVVARSRRVT